jgi:superoxide dismutase, Fe-Mn family
MTNETYRLPDLSYAYDALVPQISERQLELHHSKHHYAYVQAANEALDELAGEPDAAELDRIRRALAFNVSGHQMHSLFWTCMSPEATAEPEGEMATAVNAQFGAFERLRNQLTDAVTTLQGSGWAMLAFEPLAGLLTVSQVHDHHQFHIPGAVPLFVIDGWEHAYYLDHANDKAGWATAFWKVADWRAASERYVRHMVESRMSNV